ncbi:nucleotide exchange factor GrpE [Alkaliphilus serpentinus]|uniref:Protein GrpE n=2 Tax=Alkaliphilus serpentinus TaxID=1482731 RepID=A0A833MAG2_9FIRM|nr:nucleotide exchange factor GrpE [Alkaliphilus serpentinus]
MEEDQKIGGENVTEDEVHSNLNAEQEIIREEAEEEEGANDGVELLKKQLVEKEDEAKDCLNRLTRLQADFINYKKRVEKEKSEIYQYANEKLAEDLLSIIDNLERAVTAASEEDKSNKLFQGIQLVMKQLTDTLGRHGIEEIDALNKPFDMNLHHAVVQEEADAEADIVTEVFQKGYKINNKVLRPAMVKVAK